MEPSFIQPTITLKNPTNGKDTVYYLPHIIADKFFTSDEIISLMGEKRYDMTGTCA